MLKKCVSNRSIKLHLEQLNETDEDQYKQRRYVPRRLLSPAVRSRLLSIRSSQQGTLDTPMADDEAEYSDSDEENEQVRRKENDCLLSSSMNEPRAYPSVGPVFTAFTHSMTCVSSRSSQSSPPYNKQAYSMKEVAISNPGLTPIPLQLRLLRRHRHRRNDVVSINDISEVPSFSDAEMGRSHPSRTILLSPLHRHSRHLRTCPTATHSLMAACFGPSMPCHTTWPSAPCGGCIAWARVRCCCCSWSSTSLLAPPSCRTMSTGPTYMHCSSVRPCRYFPQLRLGLVCRRGHTDDGWVWQFGADTHWDQAVCVLLSAGGAVRACHWGGFCHGPHRIGIQGQQEVSCHCLFEMLMMCGFVMHVCDDNVPSENESYLTQLQTRDAVWPEHATTRAGACAQHVHCGGHAGDGRAVLHTQGWAQQRGRLLLHHRYMLPHHITSWHC